MHKLHKALRFITPFKVKVRKLEYHDLKEIERILIYWLINWPAKEINRSEVKKYLSNMKIFLKGKSSRIYFAAETKEGKVIGISGIQKLSAVLKHYSSSQKALELVNMYVDKDFVRQGVGCQIVDNAKSYAKNLGYEELFVICTPRFKCTGWTFYNKIHFMFIAKYMGEYWGQRGCKIFKISL